MPPAANQKKKPIGWILYMLRCSDGTLYTGITNDLIRRVKQHNKGIASKYTRSRLPVALQYKERCKNRSSALKKEYALKQLSKKEKQEYITKQPKKRAARASA